MSGQGSTNLAVRTRISTFLAETFFAVLLVFVTQKNFQKRMKKEYRKNWE
jgi:hypothetical protein